MNFLLILSKGNKEKEIKKKLPPILYISPCFPNPLTFLNISYLKKKKIKKKENKIALNLLFFNLLIISKDEIERPVIANGIVSAI